MIPRDPKDRKPGGSGVRLSPPENDWKLHDPTQRKRESKAVDISKISRQTKQDDLSRIILIVSLFLLCLAIIAGGAYLTLHPNLLNSGTSSPSVSRVAVDWASDSRAMDAFGREDVNALKLSSDQLGSFAQRYWEFEENKKNVSANESAHADSEKQQSLLWKELLGEKDIIAVQVNLREVQKTMAEEDNARYQISAARSERDLPDGGLRQVEVLFLTKIPEKLITNDQLIEMAQFNRPAVFLLAPYFIETSSESTAMRATELKHEANRGFNPMNSWVSLVNAKVAVHADLIGLRLPEIPDYQEQVYFKVVVGDLVGPPEPAQQ